MRPDVDAGADAKNESSTAGEVEIALERADVRRNVDLQITDLEVAKTEAARVETGVELADDAHLADRRRGIGAVLELDGVRLGLAL
ncbi:MAG: hypothetical protein KDI53_09895, partial [Candidatus Accumulibacter sp.]|nr:hypothetical protein [Accumulibacter sp.]